MRHRHGRTGEVLGLDSAGQLGNGAAVDSATPVSVTGLSGATAVAVGVAFACAVVTNGAVKCWGSNADLTLGTNGTSSSSVPADNLAAPSAEAAASTFSHGCVRLVTGGVQCWGKNSYSQIGDGTTINCLAPVNVAGV